MTLLSSYTSFLFVNVPRPPRGNGLRFRQARMVRSIYLLMRMIPISKGVFFMLTIRMPRASANFRQRPPSSKRRMTMTSARRFNLTLVTLFTIFGIMPHRTTRRTRMITIPQTTLLLSRPPTSLQTSYDCLMAFILTIVVPPYRITFRIRHPAINSAMLRFRQERRCHVMRRINLGNRPLCYQSVQLRNHFLPRHYQLKNQFHRTVKLRNQFQLFRFHLFLKGSFCKQFKFPMTNRQRTKTRFKGRVLRRMNMQRATPRIRRLFLTSIRCTAYLIRRPCKHVIGSVRRLFLMWCIQNNSRLTRRIPHGAFSVCTSRAIKSSNITRRVKFRKINPTL